MNHRIEFAGPLEYDPQPLAGCICPEPFVLEGELFEVRNPSCLVPGHGCVWRRLPPATSIRLRPGFGPPPDLRKER